MKDQCDKCGTKLVTFDDGIGYVAGKTVTREADDEEQEHDDERCLAVRLAAASARAAKVETERDALRAFVAAVVPHCKCGQIATYHVVHRYAEPHDDCDMCRVDYVKKADVGSHNQHSTDLQADSIDSADSWGKKLPHAEAARTLRSIQDA